MATIVGQGDYKYEIKENWAKLPDGWLFKEVAAVGVDKNDNVYCFNRGEHPVMVFDREGNFLRSWGEVHLKPGAGDLDFADMFRRIEGKGFVGHYMNAFGSLEDMLTGRDDLVRIAARICVP